jgi:GNAT superfamily N-acetyltransferase
LRTIGSQASRLRAPCAEVAVLRAARMGLCFDTDYGEDVELARGAVVHLRRVRATDKALLLDGFYRLSPTSRYRRFFSTKRQLSETELRYLTELDGVDHFAICGIVVDENRAERGIGVARFVRLSDQPNVAEAAVTVVDDWQHRGLGAILLERLAEAAAERGIERFRASVLAGNAPVRALLGQLGSAVSMQYDGEELVVDVHLATVLAGLERRATFGRLLGAIASGSA